jgi:subfamily B ATP-binding cassette protein MsbA
MSAISVYLTIPLLKTLFIGNDSLVTESPGSGFAGIYKNLQFQIENFIFSGGKQNAILLICVLIVASFFLKNLTGYSQSVLVQFVEKGVIRDIRNQLFKKINALPVKFFTEERTGHIVSLMTNDINLIQFAISAVFYNLTKDPLLVAIYLTLSLLISWELTLVTFIVFPVIIFLITRLGASLKRRSRRAQEKMSDLISIITETIYSSKIIKAFNAQEYKNESFIRESNEHYKLVKKVIRINDAVSPANEFLTIFAGVIVIWLGGREILVNNTIKPEEFLGFLFILFQLVVPIKNLGNLSNNVHEASASCDRIFRILDYPVNIEDGKDAADIKEFKSSIEFRNVWFSYNENREVIRDVSMEIRKSEVIALVGSSGAGKSTITDLLARFYDVDKGEILIDGINIREIKLESLRNLIGVVPQETILFNDTIRNNILFGLKNISDELIIETAKSANAYDFIMNTEKGFDTVIGERGMKLSGGQKQRLAMARAFLRNPQILVLDEATSSLDSESEYLVQEALEKLMANRTSVIIAHRLSTVKNADKLFVIDSGRIVESGTHDELISKDGIYRYQYNLQFGIRE